MAREIRQYTVTIPAGTTQAAPFVKDLTFPPRTVQRVELRIPPGPAGLMGFAIQNSRVTVIPYGSDQWIVTADDNLVWDLEGYPSSGSWQVAGYNTDAFDHSIYVRFLLDLVPQPAGPIAPTVPDLTSLVSTSTSTVASLTAEAEASVSG